MGPLAADASAGVNPPAHSADGSAPLLPGADGLARPAPATISGPTSIPTPRLKALGYAQKAGSAAEAIISDDVNIYVVREGGYFAGRFRVITIDPTFVEMVDGETRQTWRLSYSSSP